MTLNYNHLYYFYVVASEGGPARAARKLHLSQPALSTQIQALENQLGHRLFARVAGSRLRLSDMGALAYDHAAKLFELSDRMLEDFANHSKGRNGALRIGVADGIERPFSIRMVKAVIEREAGNCPKIQLSAESADTLMEQLLNEELDAVLSIRTSAKLVTIAMHEMPVAVAVSAERLGSGELPSRPSQILELLQSRGIEFILPTPQLSIRQDIDSFLSRHRLTVPVILETDRIASIVRGVLDGVGAAFLPPRYFETLGHELAFGGLPGGIWKQPIYLLTSPGKQGSAIGESLRWAFHQLVATPKASL